MATINPTMCPTKTDAECVRLVNDYHVCKEIWDKTDEHYGQYECVHKDFWPLKTSEWIGTFVFACFMLLANVGGIGGGGVAIPLVQIFFGFTLKPAIAISSFSILVCTFARWMFNFKEKHPEKPSMISIDYGLTNVMMPLTLIGAQVGGIMFTVSPDLVITIVLTLLLLVLAIESLRKAFEVKRKEDVIVKALSEVTASLT